MQDFDHCGVVPRVQLVAYGCIARGCFEDPEAIGIVAGLRLNAPVPETFVAATLGSKHYSSAFIKADDQTLKNSKGTYTFTSPIIGEEVVSAASARVRVFSAASI